MTTRLEFWRKVKDYDRAVPPDTVADELRRSLPQGATLLRFATHAKGGGSLGRPRYFALAEWRGGRVLREAKALVPSGWEWAHDDVAGFSRFLDLARGTFRSPDPFLDVRHRFIVRRIAADSDKLEFGKDPSVSHRASDRDGVRSRRDSCRGPATRQGAQGSATALGRLAARCCHGGDADGAGGLRQMVLLGRLRSMPAVIYSRHADPGRRTMIIDCHGHYTTSPRQHEAWRTEQIAAHGEGRAAPPRPAISDDEIRASIVGGQLKLQRERGTDLTIFSPRAAGMGHHLGDAATIRGLGQRLQRADPSRLHAVPAQLRRRLHAAADRRRVAAQLHRRAGTLRAASTASSAAT